MTALGGSLGTEAGVVSNMLLGALFFLPIYLTVFIVGGCWEVLFCIVRSTRSTRGLCHLHPVRADCPADLAVVGQAALGIAFGVVVAKELFGGTGKNLRESPWLDALSVRLSGADLG